MVFDAFVVIVMSGLPWLGIGWLLGKCRWVVKEDRLKRANALLARQLASQTQATRQAEASLETLAQERLL